MSNINVGKLVNIIYNIDTKSMRILLEITDDNFKEQILRNKDVIDKIILKGQEVMYVSNFDKDYGDKK